MLTAKLIADIKERLKRVGDFGTLTLIVKQGRVAMIETLSSERVQAGEAA